MHNKLGIKVGHMSTAKPSEKKLLPSSGEYETVQALI